MGIGGMKKGGGGGEREEEEGSWEILVFTENALTYLAGISRISVCVGL